MIFIELFVVFFLWLYLLYWIHRLGHKIKVINFFHQDHHKYIIVNGGTKWHWNNLFLFNDTWKSTIDLWLTEVIPTLFFSLISGHWWIIIVYYLWAAFLQEVVEHNKKFNWYPFLTSGKWHLLHHYDQRKNFGLFFPFWDIFHGTHKKLASR